MSKYASNPEIRRAGFNAGFYWMVVVKKDLRAEVLDLLGAEALVRITDGRKGLGISSHETPNQIEKQKLRIWWRAFDYGVCRGQERVSEVEAIPEQERVSEVEVLPEAE